MAWKKIEILSTDKMWNGKGIDLQPEEILKGEFVDKAENLGDNNSTMYVIKNEVGQRVGVWGSTVLDIRMKNIEIGQSIRLVYKGKKASEKRKGSKYHDYEVSVWEEEHL